MVNGAGGVQGDHGKAKTHGCRQGLGGRARLNGTEQIQHTAGKGRRCTDGMGSAADGVLGMWEKFMHMTVSLKFKTV